MRLSLNGGTELAIEDTGSGIDPALREKLFTPFLQQQGRGGRVSG